jgi:hypothetical protein
MKKKSQFEVENFLKWRKSKSVRIKAILSEIEGMLKQVDDLCDDETEIIMRMKHMLLDLIRPWNRETKNMVNKMRTGNDER